MEPIVVNTHFENPEYPTRVKIIDLDGHFEHAGYYSAPKYTFSVKVEVSLNLIVPIKEGKLLKLTFWTKKDSSVFSYQDDELSEEDVREWFIEGLSEDLSFHNLQGLEDIDLYKAGVPTEHDLCSEEECESKTISAIINACGDIIDTYEFSVILHCYPDYKTMKKDVNVSEKATSAVFKQDIYYDEKGNYLVENNRRCYLKEGKYTEKVLGLYSVYILSTYEGTELEPRNVEVINFWAVKGSDVVATWQRLYDEKCRMYGQIQASLNAYGLYIINDPHSEDRLSITQRYREKLLEEHGCKVESWDGLKKTVVNGEDIIFCVNDNGAIIQITDVRPNTFEDGFYYETGCTVDIDINVYNEDFSVKVPFTLKNVDTKQSCYDWFEEYWEGELEYILSWVDENGNYDGPEKDKEFYIAAKKCQENGWDFCDEYNWEDFRTEEDYENYCWDLITNTDYTNTQMSELDEIKNGIPRIESADDVFEAVDVEGTFEIYEEEGVPLGDGYLYGDLLAQGQYTIKGIKKGTEEEMMHRTVSALCKWALKNDYERHNYITISRRNFEWGDSYLSDQKDPQVEVDED